MTDCAICGKSIHTDHSEGEALKCLKKLTEYANVVREYVNKLRVLHD